MIEKRLATHEDLDQAYSANRDSLLSYAAGFGTQDAQDLVHDAACYLLKRINAGTVYAGDGFLSLFYIAIRNLAHNRGKRQKIEHDIEQQTTMLDETEYNAVFNALVNSERRQELVRQISLLDARDRDLLLLKYVYGHRSKEVGNLLNMTEDAVNSRLGRLRSILRKRLSNLHED